MHLPRSHHALNLCEHFVRCVRVPRLNGLQLVRHVGKPTQNMETLRLLTHNPCASKVFNHENLIGFTLQRFHQTIRPPFPGLKNGPQRHQLVGYGPSIELNFSRFTRASTSYSAASTLQFLPRSAKTPELKRKAACASVNRSSRCCSFSSNSSSASR